MRRYCSLLFVVALGLRSLLPVGFMLAPAAADGTMTVVICTGHGPETVTLDADGKPVPQKIADQNICPYAASAPIAVAVTAPAPGMVPASFADPLYPSDYVSEATRRWISSTLVHGPPSFQA